MTRGIHKLSESRIRSIKEPGKYHDGGGLTLNVRISGSRNWTYRYNFQKRRKEIGLGSCKTIDLTKARKRAEKFRDMLFDGKDPKEEVQKSREQQRSLIADRQFRKSFRDACDGAIAIKVPTWKNPRRQVLRWNKSLFDRCKHLLDRPVETITTQDVVEVLKPLWNSQHDTASRMRKHIEFAMSHAIANRWHTGPNPAMWDMNIEHILLKPRIKKKHHAAMHYNHIPIFFNELGREHTISALALKFTILTGIRSGVTIKAKWDQIDWNEKVWKVPYENMKDDKEFHVPLSDHIMVLLKHLYTYSPSVFIFPGQRPEKPMSDATMRKRLHEMGYPDLTVHGFRSTFRDWAGDKTDVDDDIAEHALAHTVGTSVQRAYRRGTAFEKRRILMIRWSNYCHHAKVSKKNTGLGS